MKKALNVLSIDSSLPKNIKQKNQLINELAFVGVEVL